jgi:hypothetical protein
VLFFIDLCFAVKLSPKELQSLSTAVEESFAVITRIAASISNPLAPDAALVMFSKEHDTKALDLTSSCPC